MLDLKPEKLIGCSLRINLKDQRQLDGVMTVIDPFGNILLSNTWETSVDKLNGVEQHKRELGLVSVPRESVSNILVDKKTHKVVFGSTEK